MIMTDKTVGNGTIEKFLGEKPVLFYGTTIAVPAYHGLRAVLCLREVRGLLW